jgi:predicted nucleic acid-binding protein
LAVSAKAGRVFFDTSVLLAGLIDFGDSSLAPIALLDRLAAGAIARPTTAWHCCLELFSVATRLPEEYRLTSADARRLLDEEILARFDVRDLPPARRATLFAAAESDSLVGGRIYDAEIGAVALAAGATVLVSGNRRHFAALLRHGLRVVSAGELLAELGASRP